jgi:hypothetical protein
MYMVRPGKMVVGGPSVKLCNPAMVRTEILLARKWSFDIDSRGKFWRPNENGLTAVRPFSSKDVPIQREIGL